jgi:hypothetical protein
LGTREVTVLDVGLSFPVRLPGQGLCDYPAFVSAEPKKRPIGDPWRHNEASRRRQLLEGARRPPAVNLAEGLALSEFLSTFTGSARKS